MGRKPKKDGATAAPKQTMESLSEDQRYSLTEQHRQRVEKALATKKAAATAYLNACRLAKAELGADGMEDINDLIALATPEGEARMKAQIERQMKVLEWRNVPIGSMEDMFPTTDRTPLTERAFAEGKRQGLAGESCDNPHHVTTLAHKSHNDGWAKGQEAKATKGFSKLEDDDGPKGSVPKDKWAKDLADQNEKVSADIKKSAAIGSTRATFEVH
jgi:hypothetical protein